MFANLKHRLRPLAHTLRRLLAPTVPWLERQAAPQNHSLQARMDIDESTGWFPPEFRTRFGGFHPPGDTRDYMRIAGTDRVRSDMLALLLREIIVRKIPGALAELGVHHGWSARLIHHYCPERRFYLLDTFAGFTAADLKTNRSKSASTGCRRLATPASNSCAPTFNP